MGQNSLREKGKKNPNLQQIDGRVNNLSGPALLQALRFSLVEAIISWNELQNILANDMVCVSDSCIVNFWFLYLCSFPHGYLLWGLMRILRISIAGVCHCYHKLHGKSCRAPLQGGVTGLAHSCEVFPGKLTGLTKPSSFQLCNPWPDSPGFLCVRTGTAHLQDCSFRRGALTLFQWGQKDVSRN